MRKPGASCIWARVTGSMIKKAATHCPDDTWPIRKLETPMPWIFINLEAPSNLAEYLLDSVSEL